MRRQCYGGLIRGRGRSSSDDVTSVMEASKEGVAGLPVMRGFVDHCQYLSIKEVLL